jgi:hypothetical protein
VRLFAGDDSMRDFQELADDAFRDLLPKHNRPVGFEAQMKGSAKALSMRDPTIADRRGGRSATSRERP